MSNLASYLLVGALLIDAASNIARIVAVVWATRRSEARSRLTRMESEERIRAAARVMDAVAKGVAQEIKDEERRPQGS